MKLEDIKPKYIVLNQTYDDFAQDTEIIDYETEDFISQVTDITSVLYTNSLESIWGFLGFVWDSYNNYGHFNRITMPFSIIPKIPDAHRLTEFKDNMFANIASSDIEVLDSGFVNVKRIGSICSDNKHYILHLDSITSEFSIRFNNVSYASDNNEQQINSVAFGSLELYFKNITSFIYNLLNNIASNYDGKITTFVVNDRNKDILLRNCETNNNTSIFNAIFYDEDKTFNIREVYRSTTKFFGNKHNLSFCSKQDKFIIGIFNYTAYNDTVIPLKVDNITSSIKIANKDRININYLIDVTYDFKLCEINRGSLVFTRSNNMQKKVTFDFTNFENLISQNGNILIYRLIDHICVLPELNNIIDFLNTDYNTMIDYINQGKLYKNYSSDFDKLFYQNVMYINNADIVLNLPKGTYKELDFNHGSGIGFVLENIYSVFDNNEEHTNDDYEIPFDFINAENIMFYININGRTYNIDKAGNVTFDGNIPPKLFKKLVCKGLSTNADIFSNKNYITLETTFFNIFNNSSPHIDYRSYKYINDIIESKPPIKINVNNGQNYVTCVFANDIFSYDVDNFSETQLFDKLQNDFGGFDAAEINNEVGHVFTKDDIFVIGAVLVSTSGGNYTRFKNNQLVCRTPCYMIRNNQKRNIAISYYKNNIHTICTKNLTYGGFYNTNIFVVCIQDDIHAFIAAFLDEELPEESIGKINIQIVHENFIQLTEEEKNRLVGYGYVLNDTII